MTRVSLLLLLAGTTAGLLLARLTPATQEEAQDPSVLEAGVPRLVKVIPSQEPHWDTLTIKDDVATLVLSIPDGRRFVLTDMWLLSLERVYTPAEITDRVWLENRRDGENFIVFDSILLELQLPLRWNTGVVFHESTEMWMKWDFGTDERRQRRVHYTGYWEDEPAPAR